MRIDLDRAVQTAEELLAELRELNGAEPDDAPTRVARRQRGEITRQLLYLAHLGDRARVEIMDAYHDYKNQDVRTGGEPASE
ncbi:hypothetical protein RM780_09665 [Streptomyces sp. DSM 44917]|uniref:Uncharacterized protein n=1 Tax=Streptomyces boetiae TaxID=3075541 RepID=A0ABU2L6N5_9ACTN|nr:hypothetical protein [Streptomyces sp. DSM 44917]MDT0307229.1 hypothetical protein [Streptomyces sp. DSM 44917]